MHQPPLNESAKRYSPPLGSLLKWVGNKYRFAEEITSYFPYSYGAYHEPFLGSAAIMATLSPSRGIGSDSFKPLIDFWNTLIEDPDKVIQWYSTRWQMVEAGDKKEAYEVIKKDYNDHPNPADLLFISRTCYGGVMRFRQRDGYISTPCGIHHPIKPATFNKRVSEWHHRLSKCLFKNHDYREAFELASSGDLIYCDPPYSDSQAILYGAQGFSLEELLECIARATRRGVYVALSIDGSKKSGAYRVSLPIPERLFKQEVRIQVGRSMLKRFQMFGRTLEYEHVEDRLMLNY